MEPGSDRVAGAAPTVASPVEAPRAVIFDGDDTLWLTEHLYDKARGAVRAIIERAGFDGAREPDGMPSTSPPGAAACMSSMRQGRRATSSASGWRLERRWLVPSASSRAC